ncbi:hypothetical protein SCHPADRAFT_817899 [Schizopora paradoxa]|uniref:Uncharacterized protein n=1 Tax=Schizopora paradoxa TaxID=27342 RepID=A0A0H2SR80_9AGAM|nr:hypothetical protein SCHPADRAFT_817899 [Schizopora paradoxa]
METANADSVDFFAYLGKCRNLLTIRRLRKCLRFGGIIWRLAILFLNFDDELDDSPSPDALNHPQTLVGRDALIDDGVSKEELELLTGTFEVYRMGSKATKFSYWPAHHVWSGSGFDMGAWTPDNEDWFVGRFKLYSDGGGRLLRVHEWISNINGFKDARIMMKGLEKRARSFIEQN